LKKSIQRAPTANSLQAEGMRLLREWTQLHVKRPRLLYHYTDGTGLLGMLKTHRLWATNRRFLNDPTETNYAAAVILEVIDGKKTESHLARRFLMNRDAKKLRGRFARLLERSFPHM